MLALCLSAGAGPSFPEPAFIKICSFNIAELGNKRKKKDHETIAKILKECDLIAIQEVQDRGGKRELKKIREYLNKLSSPTYQTPLSIPNAGWGPPVNILDTGWRSLDYQGYAFIYRKPVQLDKRFKPTYGLRKSKRQMNTRAPGYAHFRAGNFDFVLAAAHLSWESPSTRIMEVIDLKNWLVSFSKRPKSKERDLIIVGDMKRFGNYSPESLSKGRTAFHLLSTAPNLGKDYRLLFCEFLPSINSKWALKDEQSTTISSRRDVYDQIWVSKGVFHEFGREKAKFGKTVGVIAFDMDSPWEEIPHADTKSWVSDHRPIWAKFRIDLEDDDKPKLQPPPMR